MNWTNIHLIRRSTGSTFVFSFPRDLQHRHVKFIVRKGWPGWEVDFITRTADSEQELREDLDHESVL